MQTILAQMASHISEDRGFLEKEKKKTRHSVFGVLSENHHCACQCYPAVGCMLLIYQEGRNWVFRQFIFIVDSSIQARDNRT